VDKNTPDLDMYFMLSDDWTRNITEVPGFDLERLDSIVTYDLREHRVSRSNQ
jgi:hypothetical protein